MHMSNLCMCVYHMCQSLYHVWYHSCTVHMWNCVYDMYQYICTCTLYSRGWQANFYKSLQIANLQILGLILLSQIRKFLRCASLQIANPQIFMINPQIRKFLQISALLCLKTVLAVVFFTEFFLMCKFELEKYMLYSILLGEKVCICGLAEV
jgi:hypothetical protein